MKGNELLFGDRSDIKSKPGPYKFYVFDIDGTLVDMKKEYMFFLFNKIRQEIPEAKVPDNKEDFFNMVNHIWYEQDREKVINEKLGITSAKFWGVFRKHDTVESRKSNVVVYSDVAALKELKSKKAKIAVISDSPTNITRLEAKIVEDQAGFEFDCILSVGYKSNHNPKPHAEGLEKCVQDLGIDEYNSKVLYVGNSPKADILQAHNYNNEFTNKMQGQFELSRIANIDSLDVAGAVDLDYIRNKLFDTALIVRSGASYIMESFRNRDIYIKAELRPNYIIHSLSDLI